MRPSPTGTAVKRTLRGATVVLALTGLSLAGLVTPVQARPPIGPVQNLTAAVSKPTSAYQLTVNWSDLSGATSYKVALKDARGVVLDSDTVTSSDWVTRTTRPVLSVVRVAVTPLSATRKGRPASISKTLPDLTAPWATYDVEWSGVDATVTESGLADDVTPAASITREINWGEPGGSFEPWTTGLTNTHGYPVGNGRYVPEVRLTDDANNSALLKLHAVVIGDTAPPSGVFGVSHAAKVWARFTPVSVIQSALSDDFSPANRVVRSVVWGDGVVTPWTTGLSLNHVYKVGGTFTPRVTVADEAGNTTTVDSAAVTVLVDKVAPKVSLTVPKTGVRMVRSWKVLKGRAIDYGVGIGKVRLRLVEKRGTVWYAYKPAKKVWVKGGSTRVKAVKLAGLARVTPWRTGAWQFRVANLRKGTLVIQYSAVDKALNRTKINVRRQLLTRY